MTYSIERREWGWPRYRVISRVSGRVIGKFWTLRGAVRWISTTRWTQVPLGDSRR